MITVVGLGPAGPDEVTVGTLRGIEAHEHRFVRTTRHPSISILGDRVQSFDDVYERHDSFADVYSEIVERLVAADLEHGNVLYAVPGSPLVAERTVELLLVDPRVVVDVVPAMSFLDLTWARLRVDPQRGGVRLIDGMNFAEEIVGERGPVLVSQCHSPAVLSEIKCALSDPPETVTVLQRLGLADERVETLKWDDLDRLVEPDHLTSLWIPHLNTTLRAETQRIVQVMAQLRAQCPWDNEQTHESLAPYAIEEAYELAEAIAADAAPEATDADTEHLVEELGDVLFQVVFHACLGEEEGRFSLADVERVLSDKLVRRHPHVFGDANVTDVEGLHRQWEAIKAEERGDRASAFDPMAGLSDGLPALLFASKVLKRALAAKASEVPAGIGLFADDQCTDELLGDALLQLVAAARRYGLDPERALRLSAARLRDAVRAAHKS